MVACAGKAANMTLVIPPGVDLHFKGAVVAFPNERIVGVFGGSSPCRLVCVCARARVNISVCASLSLYRLSLYISWPHFHGVHQYK